MADIVIRNASGKPVVYNNIEETIYQTPEGSSAIFVSTDAKFLKYSQQSLTEDEKQQARTNIDTIGVSQLSPVATSGSYNNLTDKLQSGNYISISSDNKINATYSVATPTLDGLLSSSDKIKLNSISSGATKTTVSSLGSSTTEINYISIDNQEYKIVDTNDYEDLTNKPKLNGEEITGNIELATVAKSGLFNDLLQKPTTINGYSITDAYNKTEIDTKLSNKANISDLSTHIQDTAIHVTSLNKEQWNAKYNKPSNGIPSSDMTSEVQVSLGKADTALQSHQSLSAYRPSSEQDIIDNGKVAISQGISEAGKFLVIGEDGNVTTKVITTLGGGSY